MTRIGDYLRAANGLIRFEARRVEYHEKTMIGLGRILANQPSDGLNGAEFSIFSQFGEDGIIQYLINSIEISNQTFIEFGVGDFTESNCRFLMMKDNWSGFVIDGSRRNVRRIRNSYYFWKFDLKAISAHIEKGNIDHLLQRSGFDKDIGILSIDLDGIDYYVLSAIKSFRPRILICEFNPLFGSERKITVPYDRSFSRFDHHFSGLYWGASLAAFHSLARDAGLDLVGVSTAGHNAFFVRNDLIGSPLRRLTTEEAFTIPKFRDSRKKTGDMNFLDFESQREQIAGLPVLNIDTGLVEPL